MENIYGVKIRNIYKIVSPDHINQYLFIGRLYNNDGLIITPLNGNRELKVKPKSYQTIDLLFDGTNWLDQEKNNLNEIVFTDKEFDKDKIWRCYPLFKANNMLIFEPKELNF